MHKFKIGDRVRYTNPAGIYWGVFKVIGLDTRCGDHFDRRFLELGLVHSTKKAATANAKAMIGIDPYK